MVGDNMQQLEIKFFWPLTEQIPLDLDYADCEAPKLSAVKLYSNYAIRNINDITTTFVASNLSIVIIEECRKALHPELRDMISRGQAFDLIKKHFGIKEDE